MGPWGSCRLRRVGGRKQGGQNERMELVGRGRTGGRESERRTSCVKEREDMGDAGREGVGIKSKQREKRNAERDWDISNA